MLLRQRGILSFLLFDLVKLQKLNGAQVGNIYCSHFNCSELTEHIVGEEKEISSSFCVSVTAHLENWVDGRSDITKLMLQRIWLETSAAPWEELQGDP